MSDWKIVPCERDPEELVRIVDSACETDLEDWQADAFYKAAIASAPDVPDELVERMARAMGGWLSEYYEHCTEDDQRRLREMVRAAIAAI